GGWGPGGAAGAPPAPAAEAAPQPAPAPPPAASATGTAPAPSSAPPAQAPVAAPAAATAPAAPASPSPATPAARRFAREHGIDLGSLPAAARGAVTAADLAAAERARDRSPSGAPSAAPPGPAAAPASEPSSRERRIRMSERRKTIARRLVAAQREAAMLTTFNEVDMSAVIGLRERRRESFRKRHGVDLGFMPFFAKAVVGALRAFPLLNAEVDGDEIVVKEHYDLGIAVSTDEGLVVPVVRDADRKSFAELEAEIEELARRARERRLTLADLSGGTFTITNGGVFGSLLSTPILNPPQVGILGMHRILERPVAVAGRVEIRPMMYVALTYDHRVVDGREAVQFLVRVKELVEDPTALLLEG
ncbi:MAG: dihydrolipoyllysine-residue succinyltransferase, partial [Clostridia bacterium]|nr:dihydrolipoyllysine-residue succinyltransferase [Clostridia bacterium]